MTDTSAAAQDPAPEPDADASCAALLGCVVALELADLERRADPHADGSAAIAGLVHRLGELSRIAPLIRFADAPAAEDPAPARLDALHRQLQRMAPLLSRLG